MKKEKHEQIANTREYLQCCKLLKLAALGKKETKKKLLSEIDLAFIFNKYIQKCNVLRMKYTTMLHDFERQPRTTFKRTKRTRRVNREKKRNNITI